MRPNSLSLSLSKAALVPLGLTISACGFFGADDEEQAPAEAEAPAEPTKSAAGNELIECAVGGAQWFLRECEVEKTKDDAGATVLVVRHKDGGFRRFTVVTDGRGLEPADGAEQAMTEVVDGRLDVQVGSDRYRFPATVKGNAPDGSGPA